MKHTFNIKRLLLYWLLSYGIALPAYYLLYEILPNGYVFGMSFRMHLYHYQYPEQYIAIPCFFFGLLATRWADNLARAGLYAKLLWAALIISLTILVSSPFGGILWKWHDMQAGYFPENWPLILLGKGSLMGLQFGWLVIAISFPYNIFGICLAYLVMRRVSSMYRT